MTTLAIIIALAPLAGPAAALAGARARASAVAQAVGAAVALGCAIALLTALAGARPLQGWDGFLYADSLSGFFLLTVAGVTLLAALGSISYIAASRLSASRLTSTRRAANGIASPLITRVSAARIHSSALWKATAEVPAANASTTDCAP